ncbi:MAG: 30S ribosomal protein S11 [Candidatus Pacebacteria bacterium]|nr:30S ribosomal protein S11 [Candidatus Paceibacterota bacterium]
MAKYNPKKSNKKKVVTKGRIYVTATFNNTLVSVTDDKGNVVAWSSTGSSGFKGSRKSTTYAATIAAENAINQAVAMGLKKAEVFISGPGPGRDVALRVLRAKGIEIELIADTTPMPHNGTRARKQRN